VPQARPRKRKKRSKKFKFLIFLLAASAIAAVVYFNLKKEKPLETFATIEIKSGALVDKLAETGSIELVRTVEVKSTIPGEINQLMIEAGDWVEEGQLMAIIEPDPNQSLQLYQKRSAVERGQINLQEQEKDFNRTKALFESKMLPSKNFEEAETRLVRARNALRLAELELEILETKANLKHSDGPFTGAELDEVRVLAPITGIVIRRGVEIGEVVASGLSSYSGGTQLFQIGDPSQMIVRGDIAEIDIGKLQAGQEVDIIVDAYPDTTYHGRVRWIAPIGEKNQGSSIVTFDTEIDILDREPRLRQGMSCDLDIIFTRRDSTLFLPVEGVLEIFDDQEKGEEVKGKRGRFLTYVVRPAKTDSTTADSTSADSTATDNVSSANSAAVADFTPTDDAVTADSTAIAAASALVDTEDSPVPITVDNSDSTANPVDSLSTPLATLDAKDSTSADSAIAIESTTDTTALDSLAIADSTNTDSTVTDSAASAPPPTEFVLDDFVEVELEIGLETSTRIEILSGLEAGERIAADPALIRRKKEEQAKKPKKEEKKGWF
jgi:HlyD family secretion protein